MKKMDGEGVIKTGIIINLFIVLFWTLVSFRIESAWNAAHNVKCLN